MTRCFANFFIFGQGIPDHQSTYRFPPLHPISAPDARERTFVFPSQSLSKSLCFELCALRRFFARLHKHRQVLYAYTWIHICIRRFGGESSQKVVSFCSCVRAVWLLSGIRYHKWLPTFSLFGFLSFPFSLFTFFIFPLSLV